MNKPSLTTRSPYSLIKRMRRSALRLGGRWKRHDYDIRIEYADSTPIRKHVRFPTEAQALSVSTNLRQFVKTTHLPTWESRNGAVVEVEFVAGQSPQPVTDAMLPALARCLGEFHRQGYRLITLGDSLFWAEHTERVALLERHKVINAGLAKMLMERSSTLAPERIAVGFDYIDPIESNLVCRPSGEYCAIDIKNVCAEQPLGYGFAKVSHRWLTPDRRALFFHHLPADACSDYVDYFEFLRLFEGIWRAAHKTQVDIRLARLFPKTRRRRAALERLTADSH